MAKVEILKVGHALVPGVRGEKGGAPSKDSIWGIAFIDDVKHPGAKRLVKFFGRRNGSLRFKTEKNTSMNEVLALFEAKKVGKEYSYVELDDAKREELCPGLVERVAEHFDRARKAGKLNQRSTKASKPAAKTSVQADAGQ